VPGHAALAQAPRGAPLDAPDRRATGTDPEQELRMPDTVGLALLVVLEALGPAERIAFVLHASVSASSSCIRAGPLSELYGANAWQRMAIVRWPPRAVDAPRLPAFGSDIGLARDGLTSIVRRDQLAP
jgi:hypothetical protein